MMNSKASEDAVQVEVEGRLFEQLKSVSLTAKKHLLVDQRVFYNHEHRVSFPFQKTMDLHEPSTDMSLIYP